MKGSYFIWIYDSKALWFFTLTHLPVSGHGSRWECGDGIYFFVLISI